MSQLRGMGGLHPWRSHSHLSVEPDREDVVRVAVVADLRALLEVVDVHASRRGQTDHHH